MEEKDYEKYTLKIKITFIERNYLVFSKVVNSSTLDVSLAKGHAHFVTLLI